MLLGPTLGQIPLREFCFVPHPADCEMGREDEQAELFDHEQPGIKPKPVFRSPSKSVTAAEIACESLSKFS